MIKAIGIVRKVDELGRVVLPIELRRTLNIEEKTGLEFFVHGESIILQKHEPICVFCGSPEDVMLFKNKVVCRKCRIEIGGSLTRKAGP